MTEYNPRYSAAINALGLLVIFCGTVALAGWQFNALWLASLAPGLTPMNPVVAVFFLISGLWLLVFSRNRTSRILMPLAALITLFGILHIVTIFYAMDIRMDYLLYRTKIFSERIPNRIAPNTALLYTLTGISMLTVNARKEWALIIRQAIVMLAALLIYNSILGYLYNIHPAYQFSGFTPMALFTAVTFLLLNVALFLANTEYGIARMFAADLSGSRLFRSGVFFILVMPPIAGYLRLLGERRGMYPMQVGVELYTLAFGITSFTFLLMYASLDNKRSLATKRAEQQLKANEQRFRTLFVALKDGVVLSDHEGKVIYCNPSCCSILGYTEQELTGNSLARMITPKHQLKEFLQKIQDRMAGKGEDYQAEVLRKNGEKIWIDVKSRTLTDADGKITSYIASLNDITEQRLQIEDLKAFTGSAAHDLNSPLARIIAMAGFLKEEGLPEDEFKMIVEGISDTAMTMHQLLQDLLSFSRLGAGHLDKAPIDMNAMVADILKSQTPKGFNGDIIVKDLPPAAGNEGALKQLYNNLVGNAIKYSSKTERSRVEIGAREVNGQNTYYVKDNGVGLSADNLKTLFTPFKRYHTEFEGNGLGLAIVKRVVERHGGFIWVESEPNQGAIFFFTLEALD